MIHRKLLPVLFTLLPALAVALFLSGSLSPNAVAAADPFRCTDGSFYFPVNGLVGWTYQDPASTDVDSLGNVTVHTGVDVFADEGDGSVVYAPADGVVSRGPGSESLNLSLPDVTNVLTGETGIEVYVTHLRHTMTEGEEFSAGDVIGVQSGDHIHLSIGAFEGFDDREISQTQDPSPYFSASLKFNSDVEERQDASHWCYAGLAPVANSEPAAETVAVEESAPVEYVPLEYVVQEGDTLSGIAETYGVTVEALADANALTELDYISIDQVLLIPGGEQAGEEAPTSEADSSAETSPDLEPEGYVVEEGDSLSAIAELFGTDVEAIVELNGLADPDFLSIGDHLLIP